METTETALEMPKYRCHKEVGALKINSVKEINGGIILTFEENNAMLGLTQSSLNHKPQPYAGWYYIRYEDGYFSFSPAKEFEEGYTLIKEGE